MAGHTTTRTKIGASGVVLSVCKVLLTVKFSMPVWGHSEHFRSFRFSTTCYLENDWLHSKTAQNLDIAGKCLLGTGYFWPLSVRNHSEVIRYTSEFFDIRQSCVSKSADHRTNWTKIGPRDKYLIYTKYFRPLSAQAHSHAIRCRWVFKVILGLFDAFLIFPIFDKLVSQKRFDRWGKRRKKCVSGVSILCVQARLTVKCSRSLNVIWCIFVFFFSIFENHCISKMADHQAKWPKIWFSVVGGGGWGKFLVSAGYLLHLSV